MDKKNKISELTPEQTALMHEVSTEWIALALGGDTTIDEKEIESSIEWLYGLAKLSKPAVVITDSPLVSVLAARALGATVTNTNYMGLGYWSGWSAWMDFYARIGLEGVVDLEPLKQWRKFLRAGVWDVLPFDRVAFVSRRPELVKKDDAGRLHSAEGPAVRFRDGFAVYAWRGQVVPAEWIEAKDKVDPTLALTHENIEQRRALCEILGWEKVLAGLKTKVIQADEDPEIGTLIEVDIPDSGLARFLRVQCGTGRAFVLPVPVEMTTARAANAWTYSLDLQQFKPEVRT